MNFIFSFNIHGYQIVTVFWNLFLVLIPCVTVYALTAWVGRRTWAKLSSADRIFFIIFFLFWLFWFPNTAYQFMIPRHLVDYCANYDSFRVCDQGSWIVFFFFFYALLGLPAFYYALERMGGLLDRLFKVRLSLCLVLITIPLTTVGVMLGLFERANTWDIISNPLALVRQTFDHFRETDKLIFFGVFTVSLYLIYYGTKVFIRLIIRQS